MRESIDAASASLLWIHVLFLTCTPKGVDEGILVDTCSFMQPASAKQFDCHQLAN